MRITCIDASFTTRAKRESKKSEIWLHVDFVSSGVFESDLIRTEPVCVWSCQGDLLSEIHALDVWCPGLDLSPQCVFNIEDKFHSRLLLLLSGGCFKGLALWERDRQTHTERERAFSVIPALKPVPVRFLNTRLSFSERFLITEVHDCESGLMQGRRAFLMSLFLKKVS